MVPSLCTGRIAAAAAAAAATAAATAAAAAAAAAAALDGDDVHFMEQDPQDWKNNNSPTTVNFWVHVAWVFLNWLPAFGAMALRRQAKRMYMRHVDAAFKPFAQVRDSIRVTGYG